MLFEKVLYVCIFWYVLHSSYNSHASASIAIVYSWFG